MIQRITGCVAVLMGSYGVGLMLLHNEKCQEQALEDLQQCILWMTWQLRYQMLPLAELCNSAAAQHEGIIGNVMGNLSQLLDKRGFADPGQCMQEAVLSVGDIPDQALLRLYELGQSMGQFDLDSQISSLELTALHCERDLEFIRHNMEHRRRNYRTLSLCAGAAVVIILL